MGTDNALLAPGDANDVAGDGDGDVTACVDAPHPVTAAAVAAAAVAATITAETTTAAGANEAR